MTRRLASATCVLFLLLSVTQARPPEWAQPLTVAGVPNLHRVTDSLYRSAQPNAEGMRNLQELGVRTIINLRAFHSDRDEIAGTGLLAEELSVKTWHIEDEDVLRVLRIVRDPAGSPYLIHCLHGADRTGAMVAMVRMVWQGWPREKAIDELVNGGYGFHSIWTNILTYLREVDVERMRAEATR